MNISKLQKALHQRPQARARLESIDSLVLTLDQISRHPELLSAVLEACHAAPFELTPSQAETLVSDFGGGWQLRATGRLRNIAVSKSRELFVSVALRFKALSTELSLRWVALHSDYPGSPEEEWHYQLDLECDGTPQPDKLRITFPDHEKAESVASVLYALKREQVETISGPLCVSEVGVAREILKDVWH